MIRSVVILRQRTIGGVAVQVSAPRGVAIAPLAKSVQRASASSGERRPKGHHSESYVSVMLFLFARWFGCRHGTARTVRDRREEGGFRLGAPARASSPISGGGEAEGLGEKSASIAMRVALSGRSGLAGTRTEGSCRRSISASSRLSGKASVPQASHPGVLSRAG